MFWVLGEESGLEDVSFLVGVVHEGAVSVVEGQESVDRLAFAGLGEGPEVMGVLGVVEVVMGPRAFGLADDPPEVPKGLNPHGAAHEGCAGFCVGVWAVFVLPVHPFRVGGPLGWEGEVAGFSNGVVKVSDSLIEGTCSCRLSLQGVMIRMLRLDPLQVWMYHSVVMALCEGGGECGEPGIPVFRIHSVPFQRWGGDKVKTVNRVDREGECGMVGQGHIIL